MNAQIRIGEKLLRKVEDKLEQKVEDKILEKVDEKINEGDSINQEPVDTTRNSSRDPGKLFGAGDPVELNPAYTYDFSIDYTMTSADSKKPTEITYLLTSKDNYFGHIIRSDDKEGDMKVIYDTDRQCFIMLNDEKSQATVLRWNPETLSKSATGDEEAGSNNVTVRKTGKTRTIAGYLCEQYEYSGDTGSGEVWTTNEIDKKNYFFYLMDKKDREELEQNSPWKNIQGFILHSKGVDKKGKPFEMLATKVDKNASYQFDMSKYEILNLTKF